MVLFAVRTVWERARGAPLHSSCEKWIITTLYYWHLFLPRTCKLQNQPFRWHLFSTVLVQYDWRLVSVNWTFGKPSIMDMDKWKGRHLKTLCSVWHRWAFLSHVCWFTWILNSFSEGLLCIYCVLQLWLWTFKENRNDCVIFCV